MGDEAIKTEAVVFNEIHYGCGCISHLQGMVYCERHSGRDQDALKAENERLREALILAKGEIENLSCCQEPFQKNMDKINEALSGGKG